MKNIKVKCPAKINLTLEVVNRRDDGFHNINSVMQLISLYDYFCNIHFLSVQGQQKETDCCLHAVLCVILCVDGAENSHVHLQPVMSHRA